MRKGGARTILTSGQAESDGGLRLPDVERVVAEQISPYSVSRLINSIGFRLGMPREHEVARQYLPVIRAGREADVCLAVGGDTYCYGPQEHIRVINGRLHRAGKPLVLWGCSVNPELIGGEYLADLKAYDMIVARESITAQAMRDAGLSVRTWCDPAFTLTAEELPLPDGWREKQTVGLNVSPLILDHTKDKKYGAERIRRAGSPYSADERERRRADSACHMGARQRCGCAFRHQGAVCG